MLVIDNNSRVSWVCMKCGPLKAGTIECTMETARHSREEVRPILEWCDGAVMRVVASSGGPAYSRDQLLADLSRAARTCFPERAESMIAELERLTDPVPTLRPTFGSAVRIEGLSGAFQLTEIRRPSVRRVGHRMLQEVEIVAVGVLPNEIAGESITSLDVDEAPIADDEPDPLI